MLSLLKKHSLPVYFVLAFVITWTGSLIYYFSTPQGGASLPPFLALPAVFVWYFGPCLSAIIVTRGSMQQGSIRRLLSRFRIWRVGWVWYAVIILYPLVLHLLVVSVHWLLSGPTPRFFEAEGVPSGNIWLVLIGLMVYQVLVRGIGEETGWRGFALPAMQSRWNALQASLLLGILWALWHFHPANFKGLLSVFGIFEFINVIATTVIFTWVYNNTRGSLLIAALFHMTLNVAEYVVPINFTNAGLTRNLVQTVILWITIGLLVMRYGPQLCKDKLSLTE